MKEEERAELEAGLGHRFASADRLEHALTHRSHRQMADGVDNERLEFLGDRVVGLLASEELCRLFPEWDSGNLSKGLSRLVSAPSLYDAAQRLKLGSHLRLGPGEEKTGGREKKRLLADAYEAVVGAIYMDAGIEAAAKFVKRTLLDYVLNGHVEGLESGDYKSALQEWLQERALGPVEYRVRNESGPDHQKTFEVEVWLKGRKLSASKGLSKKEAEQAAARLAMVALEREDAAGA